ncbi:cbb3-type cytochrome oxidase subunit 3 [Methylotenera versatilis]|nr:CcoQ/FixQ family Cbb3-type cytochrome c oxidase assembly chaperone [Methylotenera versatilis]
MMNITDLRIVATVACFVAFIGIWIWAWSKRHKNNFNEAANLPFEGE